uniref:Variant surface glycoprotein 1125.1696 n=1 Tax=Trypanosoma brucei TaxID=5691 RepID=A0A1J0R7V7_9TRYP|nr:variant surface glycoprotein 1125.1696 [Trypanosoma brucei]
MLGITTALLFLAAVASQRGDATANGNIREFEALCDIYLLYKVKDKLTSSASEPSTTDTIEKLTNYNISTATDTYYDNKDGTLLTADKKPDSTALAVWNQKKDLDQIKKDKVPVYARLPASPMRQAANDIIKKILDQAQELKQQEVGAHAAIAADNAAISAKIQSVLFSEAQEELNKENAKGNWGAVCTHASTTKANVLTSVAVTAICLCQSTDGSNANCEHAPTTRWTAGGNDNGETIQTAWSAIKTACEKRNPPQHITSNTIRAAIVQFKSRLGLSLTHKTTTKALILGETSGSTCDGAAATLCIDYTDALATGGKGITWLSNLEQAADLVDNATNTAAHLKLLEAQQKQLVSQAEQAYTFARYAATLPAATMHQIPLQDIEAKHESAEKECNKKDKDTDCAANPKCKWRNKAEDPKKRCTLSEEGKQKEAEQATQETGGKDWKTNTNTTTQPECEAVNKDGKKRCGEEKRDDSKSDKDTVKCLHSLFSRKLKLALMVAAF